MFRNFLLKYLVKMSNPSDNTQLTYNKIQNLFCQKSLFVKYFSFFDLLRKVREISKKYLLKVPIVPKILLKITLELIYKPNVYKQCRSIVNHKKMS